MSDYLDGLVLPTTAKLRKGNYTDDDLARLRGLAAAGAYDAEAVEDAVFFPVDASANTIDSYGTFMYESTLQNFARDAERGVAVLDSHNSGRLNFGMSVTGEVLEEKVGEDTLRYMRSDFFTIPGLQTEGLNTDAYIRGVRAGLYRDVSVGFWMPPGSIVRCTICGKDMMRWWMSDACNHFAGIEYEVEGGGKTHTEVAYGGVDGGALSEYSFVHDGATPGAGVAKARHMEDVGELSPDIALQLERAFHVTFPRATRKYQGISLIGENGMTTKNKTVRVAGEDSPVDDPETTVVEEIEVEPTIIAPLDADTPDEDDEDEQEQERSAPSALKFTKTLRTSLNEKYADAGIAIGERVEDAVSTLADEVIRLRGQVSTLTADKRSLEKEAAEGRAYRTALIEELKEEVIRSASEGEDKEAKVARYVGLAEVSDVATIKGLRDDFAAIAREKYGEGRISVDNQQDSKVPKIADSAYEE